MGDNMYMCYCAVIDSFFSIYGRLVALLLLIFDAFGCYDVRLYRFQFWWFFVDTLVIVELVLGWMHWDPSIEAPGLAPTGNGPEDSCVCSDAWSSYAL